MKKLNFLMILFATSCVFTSQVIADTSITFKGNLVVPLCTVNNNTPVTVPFGDIEIQTLSQPNVAYKITDINIPLSCPYAYGEPRVTITSTSVQNASGGVLKTSKINEGLVIYLFKGDGKTILPISSEIVVSESVTGVKPNVTLNLKAGVGRIFSLDKLSPGEFTATSTLQFRYL